MKVLLVDDDKVVHRLVSTLIRMIGDITVISCFSGRDALARALAERPDLIISDVNMPELDGMDLTRQVRETPGIAETPILLLTGRSETQDKYQGFMQGADDYLVKPFDATELQLRIKALLRRAGRGPAAGPLVAGPISLDPKRYLVCSGELEVRLTASELAILQHLVQHPDQVVGVEELLVSSMGYPAGTGNPQVIHTHVKNLRAKLREGGIPTSFLVSSRQGYTLLTLGPGSET